MQHVALTHEDYRKVVKDWVMRQSDNRRQVFSDYQTCIVGQFLSENPEFRTEYSYSMETGPNVWNSTHTDTYFDPNSGVHTAAEAISAGNSFAVVSSTFGPVKEAMQKHPLWRNL